MVTVSDTGDFIPMSDAGIADAGVEAFERGPAVRIETLRLNRFRSYGDARIAVPTWARLVVLTGPNGAGKTNVLEAISYLAPGRGLRGASMVDVAHRQGSDADRDDADWGDADWGDIGTWAVSATLSVAGENIRAGTGWTAPEKRGSGGSGRRQVRIDGQTYASSAALGEHWTVSWLTPQMDRLFIEGPSARRRFLDRMVIGLHPDHARQVAAYERAMRERNRLLAGGPAADPRWLSALEARLAEHGVAIAVARVDFVAQLAGQLSGHLAEDDRDGSGQDSAFPQAALAIDGWLEGVLADGMAATDAETMMAARLETLRGEDAAKGRTGAGVHKSDLVVTHLGKNMPAGQCSTGEQKALLIALTLANCRLQTALKGRAPILLLDEVAAHLDATRREALFANLARLGGQCWITGTDRALFEDMAPGTALFEVKTGIVTAVSADVAGTTKKTEGKED